MVHSQSAKFDGVKSNEFNFRIDGIGVLQKVVFIALGDGTLLEKNPELTIKTSTDEITTQCFSINQLDSDVSKPIVFVFDTPIKVSGTTKISVKMALPRLYHMSVIITT